VSDALQTAAAPDSLVRPPSAPREGWLPGRRLLFLAALGLPLALLDGGSGLGLLAALGYDACLLAGALLEARGLARRLPRVERHVLDRLVVGRTARAELLVHNTQPGKLRLRLRDTPPPALVLGPEELAADMAPHARARLAYTITPSRRGSFQLGDVYLQLEGPLGLGALRTRVPLRETVRVYPDVLGARGDELQLRLRDQHSAGARQVRQVGGGGEFAQLREYVAGDPFRDLDWKSTAKRRRPVTRVLQQERSQTILLCLDVGRMMAGRMDDGATRAGVTKLDHALDAALMLAWFALRQGDYVGLVIFGAGVSAFVPPGRGSGHYARLLEASFDAEAQPTFVNFRTLVAFVRTRVKKRALVVLFSDLLDEEHAMPLAENAAVLRQKHLPLCVTLEEPVAVRLADAPVSHASDVYARAAAADLLMDRERVKAHLTKNGVGLVEAPASELALSTVRRYLEIKAKHAL
jgi:uncharacterized protein (DUF58 family)